MYHLEYNMLPPLPRLGMQHNNFKVTECLRDRPLYFDKIILADNALCEGQDSEQVINTHTLGTGYALRYPRGYDICRASNR